MTDPHTQPVWYIEIDGCQEGPFSALQLCEDVRVALDTPVWREEFDVWRPLSQVWELRELFDKRRKQTPPESEHQTPEPPAGSSPDDGAVLEMGWNGFPWFVWALLILLGLLMLRALFS